MTTTTQTLRRLLDEATKGPWIGSPNIPAEPERWWSIDQSLSAGEAIIASDFRVPDDARLIVAMHAALPALLDVAEAAEEICKEPVVGPHNEDVILNRVASLREALGRLNK